MTRTEQLEASLGVLLEFLSHDMPKNSRLIPEWYVASAAIQANQATAQHIMIIQTAYETACARMKHGS
jgi:hypothetical protein